MKILFIGTYLEDKIGGIRSYSHQIIKVLQYENDINVISLYDKKNIRKFKHINCKGNYLKFIFILIKNYFKADKVIWAHASLSLFFFPLSIINNSKNYLMVHGVEIWGPNVNKLRIFLCSRFSNFVGPSNYTIQKVKKYYSSNKKKYYFLHCTSGLEDSKEQNYLNPYDENYINILSVSRIEGLILNNINIMIESLRISNTSNIRFHIIGEGNKNKLKKKIKEYKLEKYIFFYDFVENLESYYFHADYLSHITDWAGLGVVNMEAFCLGTPVLVSKNSGSSEIVMDKINGHKITNDQSKEELSELLVKISNNEFDIEQIGRNAKKIYYEKYSYEHFKNYTYKIFIHPKIIFFYKNLIQTGGAENLLVNTYKIFSKKYYCEIVTLKNELFFDLNIIVKNNFFNLLSHMYFNKKNSVIIGSSGILNLYLICLIIFKKFYYHIHQPIIFSYNETDKYALNNFANIKSMYKNMDLLNHFTSKHNSFNFYQKIIITFRFFLRKKAFLFAKKTFVLSNLARTEKKIIYNIDSKVIRGGISKNFAIFKKTQNLYNSKYINIVSISRLVNDKRILETINAVHYSKNKNIKLYIYGSGNKEMEIVKHLATLNNNNIIFRGFLENHKKKEVISSADYLISLGAADFNLTVIEALYLKTQVILSNEFLYQDKIFNKEAILYTSIEKEQLINFFNKLQKKSLKEEEWIKIISYIEKKLTWETFANNLEEEIS